MYNWIQEPKGKDKEIIEKYLDLSNYKTRKNLGHL